MGKRNKKVHEQTSNRIDMMFFRHVANRFFCFVDSLSGQRVVCLSVVVFTLVLGLWVFDSKLSLNGDNAEFITLTRSLMEGTGLQYIKTPNPEVATKYPFGFPLILAPMEFLFPGDWVPMKVLVLFIFSIGMGIYYLILRTRLNFLPSLVLFLIVLISGKSYLTTDDAGVTYYGPLLLHFSHQIMSEAPYLTISLLALLLIERGLKRSGIRNNFVFLGGIFCTMCAYYVRTAGIALIVAIFLYLLLERDYRRSLFFFGCCFVAWLPWTIRNNLVGGDSVYLQQLFQVNPYYPDQGYLGMMGLVERLLENGLSYLSLYLPHLLWPYMVGGAEFNSVSIFIIVIIIYSIWQVVRFGRDKLWFLYTAAALSMALLWPWADMRFLIGITPFLFYFAGRCAMDLANLIKSRGGPWTSRIFCWGLVVTMLWGQLPGVSNLAVYSDMDYPPAWSNYYQVGKWLNKFAEDGAVIACRKIFWMYVVSGRKTVIFSFAEPPEILSQMERDNVDYVVLESLGFGQTREFLVPAVDQFRDRFTIEWADDKVPTFLLKFNR